MTPHPVPRSREVSQERAEQLVHQVILGWGADHEFTKLAATLAAKLKASNLVYEPPAPPPPPCVSCLLAATNPGVVCGTHGADAKQ